MCTNAVRLEIHEGFWSAFEVFLKATKLLMKLLFGP